MTDITLNLTVGSTLELESTTNEILNGLHSELIGYTGNQNLILSYPQKDDAPVQIDTGDQFFASVGQGDDQVSFEIKVVAVSNTPQPHLQTTYPEQIRQGALRKSNRVVPAPVTIHLLSGDEVADTAISIMNISVSGACLKSEQQLGGVDTILEIGVQTGAEQSPVNVSCMIRHVHETVEDNMPIIHHGVEFIGMDAEVQLFLWKFVQESIALR